MNAKFDHRLKEVTNGGLLAFAAVTTLSIALQNIFFVALAAWLLRRLMVRKRPPSFPVWSWVWIAFMGWALMASWLAPNQAHSLETWRKWLLVVVAWCVSDAVEDRRQLDRLLWTLLVSAALVNLGAALWYGSRPLLAWYHGMPWPTVTDHWVMDYGVEWRARGGSGGYMVLAACDSLLILFFTGLALEDESWRLPSVLVCIALIGLGLILTMTRGAWIATSIGLVGLLLWRRPRLGLVLIAVLVLIPFLFSDSLFVRRLKTVADPKNGSNRERIYMTQAGLGIIRDHPWVGVGDSLTSFDKPASGGVTEHVTGYFLRYRTPEAIVWYAANVPDREVGHLHDVPLQLAVMYGLPALGLAALFFSGLIFEGLARLRRRVGPLARGTGLGLAMGLLAFFIHGMTEYNLGAIQTAFTLWFVVGLSAAAARLDPPIPS